MCPFSPRCIRFSLRHRSSGQGEAALARSEVSPTLDGVPGINPGTRAKRGAPGNRRTRPAEAKPSRVGRVEGAGRNPSGTQGLAKAEPGAIL
jgi:hypothetical protein